jgi:hypothetical protein
MSDCYPSPNCLLPPLPSPPSKNSILRVAMEKAFSLSFSRTFTHTRCLWERLLTAYIKLDEFMIDTQKLLLLLPQA